MKNEKKEMILALGLALITLVTSARFVFADDATYQSLRQGFKVSLERNNITEGRYACILSEEEMVTLEGKVTDLNTTTPPFSFTLNYDNKEISVHLGRIVFTEEFKKLDIKNDSMVEVKRFFRTFKIDNEDVTVLTSVKIKSGDKTLDLRDEYNRPIWVGKGNRDKGIRFGRGR